MKFDTRKDQALRKGTPNDGCYKHPNKVVSENRDGDTKGLGRGLYFIANIFCTPVLSSERLERRAPVLSSEGLDELTRTLDSLTLSDKKEGSKTAPKKKQVSPSVSRLLSETPEASDPNLGRCKQAYVDAEKLTMVEVKRSLRFVCG